MCDRSHLSRAARKASKRRRIINHQSFGPSYDRMNCVDCGINVVAVGDYYMVNKTVWDRLGLMWTDNLCIPCLERRCGHEFGGSEEIERNVHVSRNPEKSLLAPHPRSLPGHGFKFSTLYIERMMTEFA